MSKKRSISTKINLVDFPLPESSKILPNPEVHSNEACIQEIYFGEQIKSGSDICSASTKSDDLFGSDDGFRDLLTYKSSASSTSGSDDIEIEATKKLTQEFQKLDNILYGEVETTPKETNNEHNQWTDKFPHLRIIGSRVKIHPSDDITPEEFVEEIIEEHSDLDYTILEENCVNTKLKIKEAVIKNVLTEVKSQLSNKRSEPYEIFSIPDITTNRNERKSENIISVKDSDSNDMTSSLSEPFLQVTTVPLHNSPFRRLNFDYQSPIMKSHLSASKWQKDDSDYSSLPHISNSSVPYSSNGTKNHQPLSANKSERHVHRSANSRKTSGTSIAKHSKHTYSPRVKNVVLPPIQNLCLDEGRSVSSTPRKFYTRPISNKLQRNSEDKPKSYLNFLDKN